MSPTHRCSYTLLVLTNCTARLPTRTQVMSTLVLSSYRGYKLLTGILTTWPTSASSVDSLVDHIMYALLTRFHNHILRKLYSPHLFSSPLVSFAQCFYTSPSLHIGRCPPPPAKDKTSCLDHCGHTLHNNPSFS